MRFASLGSGSSGNATLIATDQTRLLLDCGFTLKETERRLSNLGVAPHELTAILVTHEHSDHASGVATVARRHDVPVYLTHGTRARLKDQTLPRTTMIDAHTALRIGDIEVQPFPVPHDAAEPCQFVFSHAGAKLGILTDTGSITPHIVRCVRDCHSLILEFNHDADLLRGGPYPPSVQSRVASDYGHLENSQAASLLTQLSAGVLQRLLLAHLSGNNNTPAHALRSAASALGCDPDWPLVLAQENESDWYDVVVPAAKLAVRG